MRFRAFTFTVSVALHDSRNMSKPFTLKELRRRGLSEKECREYYQAF